MLNIPNQPLRFHGQASRRLAVRPRHLLLGTLMLNALVHAQSAPPSPSTADERALRQKGLETAPFVAESLGLTIHFPAGSAVVAERTNGNLVLSVSDRQTA